MIEVQHVSRSFGNFRAVNDISFSIKTGEIVGLLGPNGAGKTTTMRMITGYLEPSDGVIKIDGLDVVSNPVECKRKIGYMPESAPLYGEMIVADYLKYVAEMEGVDPAVKIPQLVKTCGLSDQMHKNISDLSRGNRQRVGLAHALMSDPEILILDEPTGGLDPIQVAEVRQLIKEIGKTRTVIVSTHILSEVEMLCNRVIIISKGKVAADSSIENLRSEYTHSEIVTAVIGGASEKDITEGLKTVNGVESVKVNSECETAGCISVSIGAGHNEDLRPELAKYIVGKNWNLYEMNVKKNSLEDVFKTLTLGAENEQQ